MIEDAARSEEQAEATGLPTVAQDTCLNYRWVDLRTPANQVRRLVQLSFKFILYFIFEIKGICDISISLYLYLYIYIYIYYLYTSILVGSYFMWSGWCIRQLALVFLYHIFITSLA